MLEATDPIWDTFETVYDARRHGKISDLISDWWASIGFDAEWGNYRLLMNQVMHQGSITNAAYALVPLLVHLCESNRTKFAVEYLTDVAWIEAMHRLPDSRSPAMPQPLAAAYARALKSAPDLVDAIVESSADADRIWGLNALKPALHGNAKLAMQQWTGREE